MTTNTRNFQQGFSIIEIMVALILSLILLAGVGQIYVSSKQSYLMAENMGRLQENSRFAMNILTKELRMAGFSPCPPTAEVAMALDPAGMAAAGLSADSVNFGQGSVVGFAAGTAFPADFPATGTAPGDRIADADGFMLLRGGDDTYTVDSHNPTSAVIFVEDPTGLEEGDILMVCDNENTAIFQTSNITVPSGSVVHNTGVAGISPGNCSKGLGYPVDCSGPVGNSYPYGSDAQVVKFISTVYYIGVSQDGTSRSLYRRRLLDNTAGTLAAAAAEELIDGIENMRLLYGVDLNNDRLAERYVAADEVTVGTPCSGSACTWNDVVSVRVGLLTQTPDQVRPEDDDSEYNVAGRIFDDTTHGNDRRIRNVYVSTVKIRNRGIL